MGAWLAPSDRPGGEPAGGRSIPELLLRHRAAQLADAAGRGDHVRAHELLEANADPNLADEQGRLPLHQAAFAGATEIVKELLATRADTNRADALHGNRPLQIASWEGHIEVTRRLLEAKAGVDAADGRGWTPLCSAADRGHLSTVQLLLASRADPSLAAVVSRTSVTPSQAALKGSHLKVHQAIREAQAGIAASDAIVRRPSKRLLAALSADLHRCLQGFKCMCA
mmetsp:Transcript_53984/g.144628  ORF Transcript_53984/g.144628 Transcript_53984/m.144628 type:complete len:226 (-) Transcript_53984:36-713(-)